MGTARDGGNRRPEVFQTNMSPLHETFTHAGNDATGGDESKTQLKEEPRGRSHSPRHTTDRHRRLSELELA